MLNLPHSPATTRNRDPIYSVLNKWLNGSRSLLEVAAGTGEHAAWMAPKATQISWQPSDKNEGSLSIIDAYNINNKNVLPAIQLDVMKDWPNKKYDIILCINMIHISPWKCCKSVMANAKEHLTSTGILYMYGPYKKNGIHTAPSNENFDLWLKKQNTDWGVRNLEDTINEAKLNGLLFEKHIAMPANNFSLIFTC
jgi:hypothetical protein